MTYPLSQFVPFGTVTHFMSGFSTPSGKPLYVMNLVTDVDVNLIIEEVRSRNGVPIRTLAEVVPAPSGFNLVLIAHGNKHPPH